MRYKLVTGPGSHPELGDIVYDGDTEIGPVEFFYARTGADQWSVKVTDHESDPVTAQLVDVQDGERFIGRRLVLAGSASSAGGVSPVSGEAIQGVAATTELGVPQIITQDNKEER